MTTSGIILTAMHIYKAVFSFQTHSYLFSHLILRILLVGQTNDNTNVQLDYNDDVLPGPLGADSGLDHLLMWQMDMG